MADNQDRQPIWCNLITDDNLIVILNSKDIKQLKKAVDDSHQPRITAFQDLMNVNKQGEVNMEFISNFKFLFDVDVKCLCDDLVVKVGQAGLNTIFYIGTEFARGATGIALLMCAREKDCRWILKGSPKSVLNEYISVRIVPPIASNRGNCNLWAIEDYNKSISDAFVVAGSGGFQNQTCLHIALNEILKDNLNYVYQYDAFYCSGTGIGYNITEFAKYGDMSDFLNKHNKEPITDDFMIDMLQQLFVPLFYLKQDAYQFNHSDLKSRNVFVGVDSEGKPIYKLADFDKSAIFWNGIRFYNNDYDFERFDFVKNILPNLVTETDEYYNFNVIKMGIGVGWVKDESDLVGNHMQLYTMHNRTPTFMSYDFYTFLLSLMLEPNIYKFAVNHPESVFVKIWNNLWTYPNELDLINRLTKDAYEQVGLELKVKLSYIKNLIGFYGFNLRKDVSFIKELLELKIPDVECKKRNTLLKISQDGHICVNKCRKSEGWTSYTYCNTNKYSKLGTYHDWDYCNP